MLEVFEAKLSGVKIIKLSTFEDFRGSYIESFNKQDFSSICPEEFIHDSFSFSEKNVLRGIHGDKKTWKLVSCVKGRVYSVIVNCDSESADFGKSESFVLSDSNRVQLLVPPKFGNSFLVLSDGGAIYHYKQTTYYDMNSQFTFRWNDPAFNIYWPTSNPILSERDK